MSARISSLPVVVSANIADTDILPIVVGIASNTGVTKRVSVSELRLKLGTTAPAAGRTVTSAAQYLVNNAVFNVKDYGALGDGATDDTTAIQLAITNLVAQGAGTLFFPYGTYKITAELTGGSNMDIRGDNATIKCLVRIRSYFNFDTKADVRFMGGITFDLGQTVLATYVQADYDAALYDAAMFNAAIRYKTSTNLTVQGCTFKNLYTIGILAFNSAGFCKILQNTFLSPVQAQKINMQYLHFQTLQMHVTVSNNDFDFAAPPSADFGVVPIYMANNSDDNLSSYRVLYNRFNYGGRNSVGGHQLGTVTSYGDVRNMIVHGNIMLNNLQQVIRVTVAHRVEVAYNDITMATVAGGSDQIISIEGSWSFSPGLVGIKDVRVHHNTMRDDTASTRIGVAMVTLDWSIPNEDVQIYDNSFINMKFALNSQGPYTNLRFQRNAIRGNNGGIVSITHLNGIFAAHGVTEAQSVFKGLYIMDNTFDLASGGAVPIFPDFTKAPAYTGTIEDIDISNNKLAMATLGSGSCIVGRGVAGAAIGKFRMKNNRIKNFATGVDVANFADFVMHENEFIGVTTTQVNAGSNTQEDYQGNRDNTGPIRGRAVLVAGTKVVNTNAVRAADNIRLTNVLAGGALGQLSVGAIVAGTSFTINSASGTDTSTVFWEIVH